MSARCLAYLASAGFVLLGALATAATPPQRSKLQCCTYQVADLVVPVKDFVIPAGGAEAPREEPQTTEQALMKLITETVRPRSWSAAGGAGTMDYFPLTMSLVVKQTAKAHAQIAALLADLRRRQDVEVALEMRVVSVSEAGYETLALMYGKEINADGAGFCFPSVTHLEEGALEAFLNVTQTDANCQILQAPKLTMFDGQKAAIAATEKQAYVTGVDALPGGQVIPRNEVFETGLKFTVRPVIDPSRRRVTLDVGLKLIRLDSERIGVFPVVTPVAPVAANGEAPPVAFTQFIQQPCFTTLAFEKTVQVADGRTVVFDMGSRSRETRNEYGPPILRRIPYVNRLFKNVGYGRQTEHVLCLITPRIIVQEDEEARQAGFVPPVAIRP